MDNGILENQTPPQNIEAEKAVLGAVFLNSDALIDAMEFVTADDFYKHAHQVIFKTMVELNDADEAIDAYIALRREEDDRVRMTPHPVEFELYYSV